MGFDLTALVRKWRLAWHPRAGRWHGQWARLGSELVSHPFEPILHPSRWRLWWVALFGVVGHPLFWWIWSRWLPQPYENGGLRFLMALLGLAIMSPKVCNDPSSKATAQVFSIVFWIQLPLFFCWMYLCNMGNTVWLASLCAMILIYYHLTDWRLATAGVCTGGVAAWWLFQWVVQPAAPWPEQQVAVNGVVIAFCWASALLLGVSSANLRREHLKHTLATMGIMAHELRTPLATVSLIGDVLRGQSQQPADAASQQKLGTMAGRLHTLVHNMNHHIDTQIANARLPRRPTHREHVSAHELLADTINNYPYRNTREGECVELIVRRDFIFRSSAVLFSQVIDNLLKNALHAIASTGSQPAPGDLRIEVGVLQGRGRIVVSDQGTGIDPTLQTRIFEPFFSTDRGTGHGLGLAFCERVVHGAGGTIRVKSERGHGAAFTIDLPISDSDPDTA